VKTLPEIPKHGVVATGYHNPSLLLATLRDPREFALAEVSTLDQPGVLGFQPQQSRGGRLPTHAAPERVGFPVVFVLQANSI
jgi:hypothetical protein